VILISPKNTATISTKTTLSCNIALSNQFIVILVGLGCLKIGYPILSHGLSSVSPLFDGQEFRAKYRIVPEDELLMTIKSIYGLSYQIA
jgi:hypothetical protein